MITNSFEERMAIHCPQKIQLYSANTANGIKVAAALEEIISERKLKGDTPEFDYEVCVCTCILLHVCMYGFIHVPFSIHISLSFSRLFLRLYFTSLIRFAFAPARI